MSTNAQTSQLHIDSVSKVIATFNDTVLARFLYSPEFRSAKLAKKMGLVDINQRIDRLLQQILLLKQDSILKKTSVLELKKNIGQLKQRIGEDSIATESFYNRVDTEIFVKQAIAQTQNSKHLLRDSLIRSIFNLYMFNKLKSDVLFPNLESLRANILFVKEHQENWSDLQRRFVEHEITEAKENVFYLDILSHDLFQQLKTQPLNLELIKKLERHYREPIQHKLISGLKAQLDY